MARLTDLPYELLTLLLLCSANESLVTVCRWTYDCLRHTSPRLCYKFVRQKGKWRKPRVIASALQHRFLSVGLLDQIALHEAELLTVGKRRKNKRDELDVGDIRLPGRLFAVDSGEAMPVSKKAAKRQRGLNGKRKRRGCDDGMAANGGYAASKNQQRYDIVKRLLAMSLSVKGERGNTGLLLSAKAGNLPMVRLLLKHGADVVVGGESKALLLAVVYGHLDVAKRLVKAGAPVSSLALRYAVQKRHSQIIAWLMKLGAAPDMATIKLLDKL
ncbi:hypothetical protein GGI04_002735 [Coemansia thaxteri]|uniref:Ankyrin repeat protein n=1 Tax=Coemansia thaxteri TaxID=2663907 RepID=A0A9W8EI79_9FUNG|nr:hypothetical protein H4R26_002731 [Coemansia thaxteri]KAJ2004074.1 hypothetical protein GGI04_002735 [Coemansia thaxteri]KAJ2468393.1 hypothetical protein GGI02_003709 [Coemansia sp. RSA 2322]KAJ2484638.1 hypothetical protein EV174_002281 [Coemansia sp. RSA 2320]